MCPFTASETRFSLAIHFESAHIRPARSKLLLGESAASTSALDILILMHHASIQHVPCCPPHTRDPLAASKERSQFHWKHRSYNRAKPVVCPDLRVFQTIFTAAVDTARRQLQRDWLAMKIAARSAAEGWENPQDSEMTDPKAEDARINGAIQDAKAETARAEKARVFMINLRKAVGAPDKRGDGEPWALVAYRGMDPAMKAAAAGELRNWGPALSQGVRKTSGNGAHPRVFP